ncbi:MAG: right-handed parallel beta-helix repeat-containing protein [Planctomycetota bacterium]
MGRRSEISPEKNVIQTKSNLQLSLLTKVLVFAACCLSSGLSNAQATAGVGFTESLPPEGLTVRTEPAVESEPVVLRNQVGVTIRSKHIAGDPSIVLTNCRDVTIVSCDLRSIRATDVTGLRVANSHIHDSPNNAVSLDACDDVLVQGNRFESTASGVYAHRSTHLRVVGNLCLDVRGPFPRGQLVQFDKVTGPGNLILGNVGVNHHGRSTPEDMINLYQSVGTADSPIRVEQNLLLGDPEVGSKDKSDSGSGIMLGDGGGKHQLCRDNTLINPGQVGIGVAAGGHIVVTGNTIVGDRSNVANVGLYVWHQYPKANRGPILVENNRVRWVNAGGQSNPYWNGGGFPQIIERDNAFGDPTLATDGLNSDINYQLPPIPFGEEAVYPFPIE